MQLKGEELMRFTPNRSRIASGASAAALAFVLAGSPTLAGAAFAQEQVKEETAKSVGVEEIIVTATRATTKLQDTPIAITAVTAQALEERAITSVQDVAAIVPNASFKQAQAAYGRTVTAYIRGIGQNDFNLAFEPGVSMYVDDQYYALLVGSTFDLLDLERVEVLRGPQGTLFGRNAIGGAVNLISKAPSADPEGYIDVATGSYDRLDLRAGFNMPLTDNLFLRVSGVSKFRKGYQKVLDFRCQMYKEGTPELAGNFPSLDSSNGNTLQSRDDCVIDRYGGEDMQAYRAALRYAGEGIDLTVSGDYTNDGSPVQADKQLAIEPNRSPGIAATLNPIYQALWGISYDNRFVTDSPFTTYATYADPIPAGFNSTQYRDANGNPLPASYYNGTGTRGGLQLERKARVEQWGVSGKGVFDLTDNLTATVLLGYRDVFTTGINDTDGSPLGIQTVKSVITHQQFTAEPRLSYTSDMLDVTVGGFYYDADSLTTSVVSIPFIGFHQNAYIDFKNESKSVFGHAVVKPIDGLSLTLGGRYSKDKKDVAFNNGNLSFAPVGSNDPTRYVNVRGSSFDWRLGVDYKVTDQVMVYASAATGYRPGSFNPRPFQASQLVTVEGEDMIAYEIGFKADLFDRKLRLNMAGFYSDYKQRIIPAGGAECVQNRAGQCFIPGGQTQFQDVGGPNCRTYNPATDGPQDILAGIGTVCLPRTNYVNGPATIKGIEAEVEARPIEGLTMTFTGGYNKFKADNLQRFPIKLALYVPEYTASGSIQYEVPAPAINGSITPRLDWQYQSTIAFSNLAADAQQKAYSLFNGRITYANEDGDWQVAVGATNLFDKRYYLNMFDLRLFGQPSLEAQPGKPREWYLQIKKKF